MIKRRIKNLITFMCGVILVITLFPCCLSYGMNAKLTDTLKVGYFPDYATILQPGTDGNMGYGYDYLQEIAKYTGWKYEFIECTWEEGMEMLKNGEIDLFGPMQKTPEREILYEFPQIQMGIEYGAIFASKDSEIYYEDFEFFDGMKVGMNPQNYYRNVMENYCKDKGITVTFVYTDTMDIGAELKAGKYDTYVTGDLQAIPNTTVVARISSDSYYYATTKGNTQIKASMDNALKNIFTKDKYFEKKLYEKYFGHRDVSKPSITRAEMKVIKKYPKLTVSCDNDSKPFQYVDEKTGDVCGITVDILREIGKICGIEFEFIPLDGAIETLGDGKQKQIDLVACYHEHSSPQSGIRCTDTYLKVPMVLVSKNFINLSDALDVGFCSFDDKNKAQLLQEYPKFNLKDYTNIEQAVEDLRIGKLDALFISTYTLDKLEQGSSAGFLVNSTDVKAEIEISLGSHLPNEILSTLNKGIAQLDNDAINTIIYKHTATANDKISVGALMRDNVWMILGVLTLFFTLILIIVERSNRKLKNVLYVDPITGGPSFQKFQITAAEMLHTAQPGEYIFVTIDVNNFKYINDIYGYDVGNDVLKLLAKHIKHILPQDTVYAARRAADNFVFISKRQNRQDLVKAFKNDKQFKTDVQKLLGPDYILTLSIGMYEIEDTSKSVSLMLDYAGIAKKTVKGRVGNPIAEYTAEMDNNMELKKKITIAMEAALQHDEFITCMQPKYSLEDHTLTGAEVLARWKHPEMGLLSPVLFIPLFEKNGFIEKLDLYMFEATCKMMRRWLDHGSQRIPRISVNLSRVTLDRKNLATELYGITEKYGIDTNFLEIEITEGALGDSKEKIISIINELKFVGFYISIDDFGSGYSSLSILKDMPADILKIDKEFLSETFDSQKGKKIINSVIKMSKELHLETVAEGIETEEQANTLRQMGCDIAQGYYFSRPMSPVEFEKLIYNLEKLPGKTS